MTFFARNIYSFVDHWDKPSVLGNKSKKTVTHFNHFCMLILLAFLIGKANFEDQQQMWFELYKLNALPLFHGVIDRFVNQKVDVKILCHMLHKHIPMGQRDVMRKSYRESNS